MAKNNYGFISKRYRQPDTYREIFGHYNAIYFTKSGGKVMVEAETSYLGSKTIGAEITHYEILRQDPDCRRTLNSGIKTQKKAIELIEKYINKY